MTDRFGKVESLSGFIKKLTLSQYIKIFGSIWDKKKKKASPFKLWPAQAKLADTLENSPYQYHFIGKARQMGVSEIAAELAIKTILGGEKSEVIVISRSEEDAIYFLKRRVKEKLERLPTIPGIKYPTIIRDTSSVVEFSNGSSISSITSNERAGAGRTVDLVIIDEAGQVPNFDKIWKATNATIQEAGGKIVVIGTSETGSFFNRQLEKCISGGMDDVAQLHFLSCYDKPSQDEEWAKRTMKTFDDITDFKLEYPECIEDMFLKKEGLIFKTFDPVPGGRHVNNISARELIHNSMNNLKYIIGYDHGYRHWAAGLFTLYDATEDHLYVFDEYAVKETMIPDIARNIKNRAEALPLNARKIADTAIFSEHGTKSHANIFRDHGVAFQKAIKHNAEARRGYVSDRFTFNRITIDPSCVVLINQIKNYTYNPRSEKDEPMNINDDTIDALGYIVMALFKDQPQELVAPPPAYSQERIASRERFGRAYGAGAKNLNSWQGY